jgi:hypothetical protein
MGRISLYFVFLFFGGAGVSHQRIHHHTPRRRQTKKQRTRAETPFKQANP